jgi:hypothetical protein
MTRAELPILCEVVSTTRAYTMDTLQYPALLRYRSADGVYVMKGVENEAEHRRTHQILVSLGMCAKTLESPAPSGEGPYTIWTSPYESDVFWSGVFYAVEPVPQVF